MARSGALRQKGLEGIEISRDGRLHREMRERALGRTAQVPAAALIVEEPKRRFDPIRH
jgi:hypothetical protein